MPASGLRRAGARGHGRRVVETVDEVVERDASGAQLEQRHRGGRLVLMARAASGALSVEAEGRLSWSGSVRGLREGVVDDGVIRGALRRRPVWRAGCRRTGKEPRRGDEAVRRALTAGPLCGLLGVGLTASERRKVNEVRLAADETHAEQGRSSKRRRVKAKPYGRPAAGLDPARPGLQRRQRAETGLRSTLGPELSPAERCRVAVTSPPPPVAGDFWGHGPPA